MQVLGFPLSSAYELNSLVYCYTVVFSEQDLIGFYDKMKIF